MADDRHYRAFISYSQQDGEWGKRIQLWLETYRVPVGVVTSVQLPDRLGRFFRDDDDMAAASDIAETVRDVLEATESLIVICSPRSAQSKWVNSEIRHFRRTGRERKVFAVIIDGIPNSGDPATECFPLALRAAGDPDDPDGMPIEPVGLDVRKDPRDRICARLAAGLLDVEFDDLWQRDRRRRTRNRWIAASGAAAIAVALGAALTLALLSRSEAERARELAIQFFIERASEALDESDFKLSARYAMAGRQLAPPDARYEADDAVLRTLEMTRYELESRGEDVPFREWEEAYASPDELGPEFSYVCNTLLKDGYRWFSSAEIDEDKLLTVYWPDDERDVCQGVPGVTSLSREDWLATLRTPLGGDGELFLCLDMDVTNAPSADSDRRVRNYSPQISVRGVALAVNPAPYACLSAGFGKRNERMHKGLDFTSSDGGPIYAAGAGIVIEANYRDDYGNQVLIDHGNGVHTRYAHLASFEPGMEAGRPVAAGEQIGMMGQTAAYPVPIQLHYEVLFGDYDTLRKSFGLHPVSPL